METAFTNHLAWKFRESWWELEESARKEVGDEVIAIFGQYADRVTLRGAYVTEAFRADTDLFFWMFGNRVEDIQELLLQLRHAQIGRYTTTPWSFVGMSQTAEFNKEHRPSFLKGVPARKFLCFYPYIRTADWYLMPAKERAVMLKEHGDFGRDIPGVLTNGVYAFGLGDFEWLLSFEVEDVSIISNSIRHLRETQARKYTKYEWPFIVGQRFELAEALARYE